MAKITASLLHPTQLQAIVAVSQAGSVHAAARDLGIAQPRLSRLISDAERILGIKLFDRSRAGSRVNPASDRVIKEAVFALETLKSVSKSAREPVATIRLGCLPRVLHAIFPQLLARIENRNVKFQLQISVGNSDELTADLEAGRLDVIIARRVAPAGERSSDVHAQKLYSESTVVVCGYGNSAIPNSRLHIAALSTHPWILPKRGNYSRNVMDAIVSSEGLPPLVPAIESNQFDVSLGLWVVATTRFLSIAPELAARRLERLRLVRVVSTSPSLGASPLMLQYHQHQRAYPAFETFVSAARMAARGLRGKPPQ